MAEKFKVFSGVARLVYGHPLVLNGKTDRRTKLPKLGKDGKQMMECVMGLAFPKTDPWFQWLREQMGIVAQRDWPGGQYKAAGFAWKIIDGDGVDSQGKPYNTREGYAGHYVLKCSSGYLSPVVAMDGVRLITDANEIKKGYFVRVYLEISGNGPDTESPGLYVNIGMTQLIAYGNVITSGPDVASIIANAQPVGALPPGASLTPTVNMGTPPAGVVAPDAVNYGAPAPGYPSVPAAPQPPAVAPPPPAVFPPVGWLAHPSAPGYFYRGQEVKSEAELRQLQSSVPVAPNPQFLQGGAPAGYPQPR